MPEQQARANSPQLSLDDHMRRTALLTQLAIEFRETLEAPVIVEQALRVLGGHLAHDGASVILAPAGDTQIAFTSRAGLVQPVEPEFVRALFERGLAGWVIRHGSTVSLPDVTRDRRWLQFSEQHQSGCVIVLPIRQTRVTLGALTVHRSLPHAFGGHDLLLLEGVAAQLGVALGAAQHRRNERRGREQMLALFAMSQYLAAERSDAELAAMVHERSIAIFAADYGLVFLGGEHELLTPLGLPEVLRGPAGTTLLERASEAARKAVLAQQLTMESDCVALPLVYAGQRLGALAFLRLAPGDGPPSADTTPLIGVFASMVAAACARHTELRCMPMR